MSPILLDLQTLSFVMVLVTAFLTFVMIFVWLTQKTYAGFGLWVISNIAVAGGILLLGFDGIWADLLGTSLTFSAVLIGYEGNRQFLRLKTSFFFCLSIFILQISALVYFKIIDDNIALQVSFISFLVAGISGICGFLFTGNSSEKTSFSYRFTGITYLIFAVLMVFRSGITFYVGDKNDLYRPDGIQPIFFILYILFEIIWTFNYINLNSERLQQELTAAHIELEKLATTDYLTGVNNNRRFFEISRNEIQQTKRFQQSLSLIIFDIDHFKKINDAYGHAAGDKVLIEISNLCRNSLRGKDLLARIGGEEFAVLLTDTDINGAKIVAEYLRETITEAEFLSNKIKVTASFGIAELAVMDTEIQTVMERADAALYEAKRKGRNQVISEISGVSFASLRTA